MKRARWYHFAAIVVLANVGGFIAYVACTVSPWSERAVGMSVSFALTSIGLSVLSGVRRIQP